MYNKGYAEQRHMTPFRRLFYLLPAVLLLAFSSPSRAGRVEDREDGVTVIHLSLSNLPDPADSSPNTRATLASIRKFIEIFPDIFAERWRDTATANPTLYGQHNWDRVEIKLEKSAGISVPNTETDLLQIAGGMAPDLIYINFRKSSTYIENSFLYPLDEYIATLTEGGYEMRVHPKIDPVIRRKGPDGVMHVWAMPFGGALGRVLLYRKDLFDKHGLAYPDIDYTWEDMLRDCRIIADPANGIYGTRALAGGYYWLPFLWSMGGEVMVYNKDSDRWHCTFGSREAAIALEFYARLAAEKWVDKEGRIRRGYTAIEAGDALAKWHRGQIGMLFGYIDETMLAYLDPETTGMVPVPLGYPDPVTGVRTRGAELNSAMLGIFSEIKEKAVRDAAWEYMRYSTSIDSLRIRTAVLVEGGMGQFINPKYLKLCGGYDDLLMRSSGNAVKVFNTAIETGHPEPYGRNSNLAYSMMAPAVFDSIRLARSDLLPKDYEARLNAIQKILKSAENRANEMMLGIISTQERRTRRIVGGIVLTCMLIVFAFIFRRIMKAFTPSGAIVNNKGKWQFLRYRWSYLILTPAVISVIFWGYIPLLRGSYMAFFDYKLLGKSAFVGIDNFGDLLFDSLWWQACWNSARYSFFVIGMTFLPPILLAIALQEVPKGKLLYRMIFYLPAVITGIVTVLLWKQFYEPSENGALNALMMRIPAIGFLGFGFAMMSGFFAFARRLRIHEMWVAMFCFIIAGIGVFSVFAGLATPILFPPAETLGESLPHLFSRLFVPVPEPYRWLTDTKTAMFSCVLPAVWAGMGPGCLIYLAALKGIPDDYYEAADIDGAGFIDKIIFVVFPMLKALIIINFVGVFINSWYGAAGSILAMTGGQANTETVGLHIWYKAFAFLKFGSATAGAWMLGFMMIGFTMNQLRILSRVEFRAQGTEK